MKPANKVLVSPDPVDNVKTGADMVAIGIDLGTTCCCVSYLENGNVTIIPNGREKTTPSYIAITEEEGIIVGKRAKEEVYQIPENVVYDTKRLIGRQYNDKYIQNDIKRFTFKVVNNENSPTIELTLNDAPVSYKPKEISGMLLEHIKGLAETHLKKKVSGCVITVPAHFNYFQRTETREAANLAGLHVLRIINEPTAAALAYVHKYRIENAKKLLVFDLGGGTLDISIAVVENTSVTVIATAGNTHLGGRDFDNNLAEIICRKVANQSSCNEIAQRRIHACSENLKVQLSTSAEVTFDLPYLIENKVTIFRSEFEEANESLFRSAIDLVKNCLKDAKLGTEDIDDVVLVGGSTRIPKVREMISTLFNGRSLCTTINPEEAVAYGAAIQTAQSDKNNKIAVTVNDITPLSLGVSALGNLMSVLVPRNSRIPAVKNKNFRTTHDKQKECTFEVYEGERPLATDNIKIGTFSLKLPPKPLGYLIRVTFALDGDGILQVTAKDKSGLHMALSITYNYENDQDIADKLKNVKLNEVYDHKKKKAAMQWSDLVIYCERLVAICKYDNNGMCENDKICLLAIAKTTLVWLYENEEINGSFSEMVSLAAKTTETKTSSTPIIAKYGYPDVFEMKTSHFKKLFRGESRGNSS